MSRTKFSPTESSKKRLLRLTPLFASIPSASQPKFASNAPQGPLLVEDVEQHVQELIANLPPGAPVYISRTKTRGLLASLRMHISGRRLPDFAEAINAAINEYQLRLLPERIPLSAWLPRYEKILALLRKLRSLLPDADKDDLLFRIISYFGEHHAGSHGPHPDLPPYELEDPLDNMWFTVNYRSSERLKTLITSVQEVADWMQNFADARVDEIEESPEEKLSAAIWLTGHELPRIYEAFFNRSFGVSLSTKSYGPGVRFIIHVLDAAEITAPSGKKFSPHTIRTYRRRAQQAMATVKP
jgi:hypothetical protein